MCDPGAAKVTRRLRLSRSTPFGGLVGVGTATGKYMRSLSNGHCGLCGWGPSAPTDFPRGGAYFVDDLPYSYDANERLRVS